MNLSYIYTHTKNLTLVVLKQDQIRYKYRFLQHYISYALFAGRKYALNSSKRHRNTTNGCICPISCACEVDATD